MIRGTRRPGGAGRRMSSKGRGTKGGGGKGSDSQAPGCSLLIFAGSALMLTSGAAGLALAVIAR